MMHKNSILFLTIVLLFGLGMGVYFGVTSADGVSNYLSNYSVNLLEQQTHFSFNHFAVCSVLLISSFMLIGIPLSIAYLFYEGMSIGFCFSVFFSSFHFQGFLFILVFLLFTKFVFLLFYFLFFFKIQELGRNIISWILYKKSKKDVIVHLTVGCLVLIFLLFCYDLLLDYGLMRFIRNLSFLLH